MREMSQAAKVRYVRDLLLIYEGQNRPAANAYLWIMLKLSCGRTEAEKLIEAARR